MSKLASTVSLTITKCGECPHVETQSYSLDGFDRGERYKCRKADGRVIADWVEWSEHDEPKPPAWCPLRKKAK